MSRVAPVHSVPAVKTTKTEAAAAAAAKAPNAIKLNNELYKKSLEKCHREQIKNSNTLDACWHSRVLTFAPPHSKQM